MKQLLNYFKCLFSGHVEFNFGAKGVATFVQSKDVGNTYVMMKYCARCQTFYGVCNELSAEELKAEEELSNQIEDKIQQLQRKMGFAVPNETKETLN